MNLDKTYFDFAEDDYQYFDHDYKSGRIANYMVSLGQNICERYLKHIIDHFILSQTQQDSDEKANIMHTHSLNKLIKYIEIKNIYTFSDPDKIQIKAIDGFYFSTRYPSDESMDIDKGDLDNCMVAINICRNATIELIQLQQQNNEQIFNNDFEVRN